MKTRIPAVAGWFTTDADNPQLIGTRCNACGTVFFPREKVRCRNPHCGGRDFADQELSTEGTLWSYTAANFQPPEPYIPRRLPFETFALAAVELADEKMVVLGQVADGTDYASLEVGQKMALTLNTLFEDETTETLTWAWRPVEAR